MRLCGSNNQSFCFLGCLQGWDSSPPQLRPSNAHPHFPATSAPAAASLHRASQAPHCAPPPLTPQSPTLASLVVLGRTDQLPAPGVWETRPEHSTPARYLPRALHRNPRSGPSRRRLPSRHRALPVDRPSPPASSVCAQPPPARLPAASAHPELQLASPLPSQRRPCHSSSPTRVPAAETPDPHPLCGLRRLSWCPPDLCGRPL